MRGQRVCDAMGVSSIHVADDTFVAAAPARVAVILGDRSAWRRWWPGLDLVVREDRAEKGVRWQVHGPLDGTMEVWLEAVLDGTILHYFLHAEPAGPGAEAVLKDLATANRARRAQGRAMAFEAKLGAERGRRVGEPAVAAPAAG